MRQAPCETNPTTVPFVLLYGIFLLNKAWAPVSIAGFFLAWHQGKVMFCAIWLAFQACQNSIRNRSWIWRAVSFTGETAGKPDAVPWRP